ncbi:adenylate/guanylate cyclase domain-containing protein [Sulfitobacter sp. D35]|uniref:adenylate/guanylate cyclase domain-containing protein n=1 Tax=Sulfitobacter sp. D35 TaxID=3083252 RepID=UPI00296E6D4D|nr:adenylate/guanylate cyclase domain-containing protein [Sulfitobacter sp. D35]MDW4500356.1 adenylate/guanylate cyclase domain-containing protein [Sulfitobacter sp. D35]
MSIEAINEQLLRAIGVGVALVDIDSLVLVYRNDTFDEWFASNGPTATLQDLLPTLDITAMRAGLEAEGRHSAEVSFKLRRRRMTVATEFNRAEEAGARIAVLVCQNITRIKELESMIDSYSVMVERNTFEIKREKEQVEKLLLDMMPRAAYEEYKSFGIVAPRHFAPVSVLTLDFAGFDAMLADHDPGVIVSELNDLYGAFDRIGEQFGCQRIRTHGDSYVAVAGVPDPVADHASAVANSAIRYLRYLERRNESHAIRWQARIGVASGSVVGSVVGVKRYIYDVFGPAVTRALTLRARAAPMTLLADRDHAALLDEGFDRAPAGDDACALTLAQHGSVAGPGGQ